MDSDDALGTELAETTGSLAGCGNEARATFRDICTGIPDKYSYNCLMTDDFFHRSIHM